MLGWSQDHRAGAAPPRVDPRPALRAQQQPAAQHPIRPHLPSGTQKPAAATLPVTGGGPDSSGRPATGGVAASGRGESSGEGWSAGERSPVGEVSAAGGEPAAGEPSTAEALPAALPTSIVTPPVLLDHSPAYPRDAYIVAVDRSLLIPELRLFASEGRVVVRVLVRTDGTVGTVLVNQSSGNPPLDRAAVEAAASWRFQPATRDGVAIDAWAVIPVRFVLY